MDALARPRCIECDATLAVARGPLCVPCWQRLPWWRLVDGCPRCGAVRPLAALPALDGDLGRSEGCSGCLVEGSALHVCRSLVRYEGSVRRWIPGFKHSRSPFGPSIALRLAIDHLAGELARRVASETHARPDLIVSIPLHPRRRRRRRFNHAEPIAKRIARSLGRPWAPHALERTHETRSQAGLVGRERAENVRSVFRARARLDGTPCIWLVDDVLTTGSTLDAAAEALLEAGALEIRGLTLAATLPARRARRRRSAYHADASDERSKAPE